MNTADRQNKLFLLLLKYIPIIQLISILISNTIYYLDIDARYSYTLDFINGHSLLFGIFLYVATRIFKFCNYQRAIIIANTINILIAGIDSIITIPVTDLHYLVLVYIISAIGLIVATYNHIKNK